MEQRLIDANKIEFNTVRYPIGAPWPPNKEEQPTMGEFEFVSKYQIENQPTVEAIPIEYIESTIKLAEEVKAVKYAEYLSILVNDWRKENE